MCSFTFYDIHNVTDLDALRDTIQDFVNHVVRDVQRNAAYNSIQWKTDFNIAKIEVVSQTSRLVRVKISTSRGDTVGYFAVQRCGHDDWEVVDGTSVPVDVYTDAVIGYDIYDKLK